MADNIKVAIRVRPLIPREIKKNEQPRWLVENSTIYQTDEQGQKGESYNFDHIFDGGIKNDEIYSTVGKPLVETALKGINSTIFAYGQTSSGKTYTMMGNKTETGFVPMAVKDMFKLIDQTPMRKFLIRTSYIEIYNEKINDLLNKDEKDPPKLREDCHGNVFLVNVIEKISVSFEEVLNVMLKGEKNRQIGETNMNERSSRSHTIFRIIIESSELTDALNADTPVQVSQLNFVDLAGSERISQTKASGVRLKEGSHINKSLSVLGLVIRQLSEGAEFVNFRDSKLTRMLQHSLGGNAKTLIIAAITPVSIENSQTTLAFAQRAKTIKNKPEVNEILTDTALMKKYEVKVTNLKKELTAQYTLNKDLETDQAKKDRIITELKERIHMLEKNYIFSQKPQSKRRHTIGHHVRSTQLRPIEETLQILENDVPFESETPIDQFEIDLIEAEKEKQSFHSDRLIAGQKLCHTTAIPCRKKLRINIDPRTKPPDCLTPLKDSNIEEASKENIYGNNTELTTSTPKSVLRTRLQVLQQEFEDLKLFTKIENQVNSEDTIEGLQSQLRQARVNYSDLKIEYNSHLKACTQDKQNLTVELDKQIKENIAKMKVWEEDMERYEKKIHTLEAKLANEFELRNKVANEYDREVKELTQKLNDQECIIEQMKIKFKQREQDLLAELESRPPLKVTVPKNPDEIALPRPAEQPNLDENNEENIEYRKDLRVIYEDLNSLQSILSSQGCTEKCKTANENMLILKEENLEMKAEIESLQGKLKLASADIINADEFNYIKQENIELKAEVELLKSKLKADLITTLKTDELDNLPTEKTAENWLDENKNVQTLVQENMELKNEIKMLQSNLASTSIMNTKDINKSSLGDIEKMEQHKENDTCNQSECNLKQMESIVTEKDSEIHSYKLKVEELRVDNETLKQNIKSLEDILSEKSVENEELKLKIENLIMNQEERDFEILEIKKNIAKYEDECKTITDRKELITFVNEYIKTLNEKKSEKDAEIDYIKGVLNAQLEQNTLEQNQLKDLISKKDEEINTINEERNQLMLYITACLKNLELDNENIDDKNLKVITEVIIENYMGKCRTLQAELEKLSKNTKNDEERISDMKNFYSEKIFGIEADKNELMNTVNQQTYKIEQKENEITKLTQTLTNIEYKLEEESKKSWKQREAIDNLKTEILQKQNKITELQDIITGMEYDAQNQQDKISKENHLNKALEKSIMDYKNKLLEKEQIIKNLDSSLQKHIKEVEELTKTNEVLKHELNMKDLEFQEKTQETVQLKIKNNGLNEILEQLQTQTYFTQNQVDQLQLALGLENVEFNTLLQKINSLKVELDRNVLNYKNLEQQVQTQTYFTQNQMNVLQSALELEDTEFDTLLHKINSLKFEVEQNVLKYNTLEDQMQAQTYFTENQTKELQSVLGLETVEFKSLLQKINYLKFELEQQVLNYNTLEQQMQAQTSFTENQMKELQSVLGLDTVEFDSLLQKINYLKFELEQKVFKYNTLEEQMQSQTYFTENQTKDLQSVLGLETVEFNSLLQKINYLKFELEQQVLKYNTLEQQMQAQTSFTENQMKELQSVLGLDTVEFDSLLQKINYLKFELEQKVCKYNTLEEQMQSQTYLTENQTKDLQSVLGLETVEFKSLLQKINYLKFELEQQMLNYNTLEQQMQAQTSFTENQMKELQSVLGLETVEFNSLLQKINDLKFELEQKVLNYSTLEEQVRKLMNATADKSQKELVAFEKNSEEIIPKNAYLYEIFQDMKTKCDSACKEHEKLHNENNQLLNENKSLLSKIEDLNKQISNNVDEYNSIIDKNKKLLNKVSDMEANIYNNEQTMNEYKNNYNTLLKQNLELNEKLTEEENTLKKLKSVSQDVQFENINLQTKIMELRDREIANQNEIKQLTSTINALQTMNTNILEESQSIKLTINDNEMAISKLQNQIEEQGKLTVQAEKLQNTIENLQQDKQLLEKKVNDKETAVTKLQSQIEELQKLSIQIKELQNANEKLLQDNKIFEKTLREDQIAKEKLQCQMEEQEKLLSQINELQNVNGKLLKDKQLFAKRLKEDELAMLKLQNQSKEAIAEKTKLSNQINELQTANETLLQKKQMLKNKLRENENIVLKLRNCNEEARIEKAKLSAEMDKLLKMNESLQQNKQVLENKLDGLQKAIKNLQEENKDLAVNKIKLQAQIINIQEKEIDTKLSDKLDELQSKNEELIKENQLLQKKINATVECIRCKEIQEKLSNLEEEYKSLDKELDGACDVINDLRYQLRENEHERKILLEQLKEVDKTNRRSSMDIRKERRRSIQNVNRSLAIDDCIQCETLLKEKNRLQTEIVETNRKCADLQDQVLKLTAELVNPERPDSYEYYKSLCEMQQKQLKRLKKLSKDASIQVDIIDLSVKKYKEEKGTSEELSKLQQKYDQLKLIARYRGNQIEELQKIIDSLRT